MEALEAQVKNLKEIGRGNNAKAKFRFDAYESKINAGLEKQKELEETVSTLQAQTQELTEAKAALEASALNQGTVPVAPASSDTVSSFRYFSGAIADDLMNDRRHCKLRKKRWLQNEIICWRRKRLGLRKLPETALAMERFRIQSAKNSFKLEILLKLRPRLVSHELPC
jgi:hypothetical protein